MLWTYFLPVYCWSFSPAFLHVILGLFMNWHNLSTLSLLRLFSGRPEFLVCKAIRKYNFWERVYTISFLFFGLFGEAFIIFLRLLLFTKLLENEDSGEFGILFSFDLFVLIPYTLFFYCCNLTRSFTFNKTILYFFPKGVVVAAFLSVFFLIASTFFFIYQWSYCSSVKIIS